MMFINLINSAIGGTDLSVVVVYLKLNRKVGLKLWKRSKQIDHGA